mmetsp:Transcript_5551/g.15581  ORF Transcript_5551/g.15581 Transcript_5551/m.15581 type:complete len:209 (-) Transcript_5551:24-650(-)
MSAFRRALPRRCALCMGRCAPGRRERRLGAFGRRPPRKGLGPAVALSEPQDALAAHQPCQRGRLAFSGHCKAVVPDRETGACRSPQRRSQRPHRRLLRRLPRVESRLHRRVRRGAHHAQLLRRQGAARAAKRCGFADLGGVVRADSALGRRRRRGNSRLGRTRVFGRRRHVDGHRRPRQRAPPPRRDARAASANDAALCHGGRPDQRC